MIVKQTFVKYKITLTDFFRILLFLLGEIWWIQGSERISFRKEKNEDSPITSLSSNIYEGMQEVIESIEALLAYYFRGLL